MKKFAGFTDEVSHEIEAQIAVTKELGWSGIEARMVTQNGKSVHFDDVDESTFLDIKDKLDTAGIQIISYGSQIANWSRKVTSDFKLDTDELKRIIPRMQKTGTKLVRIMSYPNDGLPESDFRKEVLRRMKVMAKMAEDGGIILAHENCSGYGALGARETLDMLGETNSPALKLIFDMGNCSAYGLNAWDFYQGVKTHVVHIHIKDYRKDPTATDGHSACFPGEGDDFVAKIVADAKRSGYSGWFSIEPHIAAVAHEGKQTDGADKSKEIFLKYGRMFEAIYSLPLLS